MPHLTSAVPTLAPNPAPDRIGLGAAGHLARALTAVTGRRRAVVLLADPSTRLELARHVDGPPLVSIDGDAVLALVLPSQATVCDTARLHETALRCLATQWRTERLLVAPCTFGHELVAVAVAAVAPAAEAPLVERAARPLVDRFAAAVIGTRLFTVPAARDSQLFSIGA